MSSKVTMERDVSGLLGEAADLIRTAVARVDRQRSEKPELVEHYPDVTYSQIAAGWFSRVRREVLYLHGGSGTCPKELSSCADPALALAARGIAVRLLYHPEMRLDCPCVEFARHMRAAGAVLRVAEACRFGAVFFDRRAALVWENTPLGHQDCVLIRSGAIVAPLLGMAEAAWQSGHELDDLALAYDDRGEVRTDVLGLLGSGLTDGAAARQLGISVRTYRRHVADLMRRLGAESRFQAGARAATLGLMTTSLPPRVPGTCSA